MPQEEGKEEDAPSPTEEHAPKMSMKYINSLECKPVYLKVLETNEPSMVCASHNNNPDSFAAFLTSLNW